MPQKRGDSSDVEEGQEAVPRHRANRQQGEEPEGVYIISVAARILEMHPQTLRKYERAGLVNPSRTEGMLRLYSEADILRLRLIKHLVENLGLNLAGVELALSLVNQVMNMLQQLSYLEQVNPHDLFDERLEDIFNIMDMPFR